MRSYVFAAVLAGTVAAPAFAQASAPTFTGLRVEGVVGYDNVEGDDGVVYGVGAGYDFQAGGAVLGVEAELSDGTIDQCENGAIIPGDQLCAQIGRDIYVGGRVGTLLGSKALLYVKGGYVNGRVELDYDDGTAGGATSFNTGGSLDGFRVGGGAEYAISPNTFVKAEYRYSNYEAGLDKHQGVVGFGFRF